MPKVIKTFEIIADEETTYLACAITELAAKDLRRAIRRDILMKQFNSRYTNKYVEKMSKSHATQFQDSIDEYDKIEKKGKFNMYIVDETMTTKSILQYFALMGKDNICHYIITKLIQYETENIKAVDEYGDDFIDSYKKKFLDIYEKEVIKFG